MNAKLFFIGMLLETPKGTSPANRVYSYHVTSIITAPPAIVNRAKRTPLRRGEFRAIRFALSGE
jgi:hypothetical protein